MAIALPLLMAQPAWACEVLPLISPPANSFLSPEQAEMKWGAHPSGNYRVQVRVSQPEGSTMQVFDLNTQAPSWRLPPSLALPSGLASVQARISVHCPVAGMDDLLSAPVAFMVQQPEPCEVNPSSIKLNGSMLSWSATPGAQSYRAQVAALPTKQTLARVLEVQGLLPPKLMLFGLVEVSTPQAQMGKALEEASLTKTSASPVVTVQAVCGGKMGLPAALSIERLKAP